MEIHGQPNTVAALSNKEMFRYPLDKNSVLPMNVLERGKLSACARHWTQAFQSTTRLLYCWVMSLR